MSQQRMFARALAVVLSTNLCFPVVAAESTVAELKLQPNAALQMQLASGGVLQGRVVDRQGTPQPNLAVKIVGKHAATVSKTDQDGLFATSGLQSGDYRISVANESQMIRAWNAETAPPHTKQTALLIVGTTVRGQCAADCGNCSSCWAVDQSSQSGYGTVFSGGGAGSGYGGGGGVLRRPWILGAGVAAAIAIPLALDDDDAS